MATISFEVPDEEIRGIQSEGRRRSTWEAIAESGICTSDRLWARAVLAALDYPLPPKVDVGDVVKWGHSHTEGGDTRPPFRVVHVEGGHAMAVHDYEIPMTRKAAVLLDLSALPDGFEVVQ